MKIAVIGGGAAGMFAAIVAAESGADVTLYEKNEKLGKKLYITGKGRCNLTNDCDEKEFLSNVVTNSKFLYSAIYRWNSAKTMDFFTANGLDIKTERGNRVFPCSDKASDVTKVLVEKLKSNNVKVRLNSAVKSITITNNGYSISTITDIVFYDRVIIATGGVSYPTTGSSGDGYKLAKSLGHDVVATKPALSEIILNENVKPLEGLSLKNVVLRAEVVSDSPKPQVVFTEMGEMLFTAEGISGPLALSCSSYINKYAPEGVKLYIDLKPALPLTAQGDKPSLDARLQRDFAEFHSKEFKNSLVNLLPQRLCEYLVNLSGIDGWQKVHQITAPQRLKLAELLKNLPFSVARLANIEYAIITSGGIAVPAVNPSTMESRRCRGLYFAGEVLDVDALTGGFNMQIAFATGYVAGSSAGKLALFYQ
jgi:predicted Rossmann fold flavoprotein